MFVVRVYASVFYLFMLHAWARTLQINVNVNVKVRQPQNHIKVTLPILSWFSMWNALAIYGTSWTETVREYLITTNLTYQTVAPVPDSKGARPRISPCCLSKGIQWNQFWLLVHLFLNISSTSSYPSSEIINKQLRLQPVSSSTWCEKFFQWENRFLRFLV